MKALLLVLGMLISFGAQADVYKTRLGQDFVKLDGDRFGIAWQAPDGSVWSQYQGSFSNHGSLGVEVADGDFAVLKSSATEACARIGGDLPTLAQFKILAGYFESSEEFQQLFPFPSSVRLFWTANGRSGFARFVKLAPFLDPYGDFASDAKELAVMCRKEKAQLFAVP